MRIVLLYFIFLIFCGCQKENRLSVSNLITEPQPVLNTAKLEKKAQKALAFCKTENFHTNFCILIDESPFRA